MVRRRIAPGTTGVITTRRVPDPRRAAAPGATRWVAETRVTDELGRRWHRRVVADTKSAAIAALQDAIKGTTTREATAPDPRRTTVGAYLDRYAEATAKRRLAVGTLDLYAAQIKAARALVGDLTLADATPGRLARALDAAADRPSVRKTARRHVAAALALAVLDGALPANPGLSVPPGGGDPEPHTVRFLTDDAERALRLVVAHAEQPRAHGPHPRGTLMLYVDLALASGGRIGELLALRWGLDVDPMTGIVSITGTVVQRAGGGTYKTYRQERPKRPASVRTLQLPRWGAAVLREAYEAAEPARGAWVFPSRTGTLIEPNNFRRTWRAALTPATDDPQDIATAKKLLVGVTPHTLRRTVGTRLYAAGVPLEAIRDQLGHASISETERAYVGRTGQTVTAAADALPRLASEADSSRVEALAARQERADDEAFWDAVARGEVRPPGADDDWEPEGGGGYLDEW